MIFTNKATRNIANSFMIYATTPLYYYQPPKILAGSAGWRSSGTFGFQVQGWPRPYRVETSTNLTDWALVPSTNLLGPAFEFSDTNATGFRQQFYRVHEAH